MAFSDKHQCICDCHSGKCDESECGSYRAK